MSKEHSLHVSEVQSSHGLHVKETQPTCHWSTVLSQSTCQRSTAYMSLKHSLFTVYMSKKHSLHVSEQQSSHSHMSKKRSLHIQMQIIFQVFPIVPHFRSSPVPDLRELPSLKYRSPTAAIIISCSKSRWSLTSPLPDLSFQALSSPTRPASCKFRHGHGARSRWSVSSHHLPSEFECRIYLYSARNDTAPNSWPQIWNWQQSQACC